VRIKSLTLLIILSLLAPTAFADKLNGGIQLKSSKEREAELLKMNSDQFDSSFAIHDESTGTAYSTYSTKDDLWHLAGGLIANANPMQFGTKSGFDFTISRRVESPWIDFYTSSQKATVSSISSKGSTASANISIMTIGLSQRIKLAQTLVKSDRIFETIGFGIGTYAVKDDLYSYKGYGLHADYTLSHRFSQTFYYGLRYSYHMAPLERPEAYDQEPKKDRLLMTSWLHMALEFGCYF